MAASRTSGVINGTDLAVYNSTNLIGASTTCSLQMSADMRDTSNKDTAGWKKVLPGQKSWTVSTEGLVAHSVSNNFAYLFGLWSAKTALTLNFRSVSNYAGDYYWSGTAYITSLSLNAGNEQNVTFSVSFQGDGVLTQTDPLV